uniref:uncharacterized protein LOC122600648 n=1 Tax=Erigeron canadensis TaxID=72917 RepID=UPI001CB8D1B8|nr:uncharacterized protein LOC122600648 [Erigeron canadensis]
MDSDRPSHHRTGDLFVCFTARNHHHSSSMRSILCSNRSGPRDPPISLTTSLSRRLRTNRSVKGAASPAMFPTTGKKRSGNGFDNPEPSSPKVTCIGQVRVKSKKKLGRKKQGNQQRLRSLSRRHSTGDVSFRKLDHSHDGFSKSAKLGENYQMGRSKSTNLGSNQDLFKEQRNSHNYSQKWVHLPLTICEALRAFGSEFSCLFPCRSSCFSPAPERKPAEETGEVGSCSVSGSCARLFTRWLMAFQDGDDGDNRRDSQLVVNDENEEEDCNEDSEFMVSRRHVFNDLEIVNNRIEGFIDEARVSICIPPKNALLLMRCRSDPLKMQALANRLWESTNGQSDDDDEQDNNEYIVDEYENDEISQKRYDFYESRENVEVYQEKKVNQDQEIGESNDDYEDDFVTFFGSLFENVDGDNDEMLDGEGLFDTGDEIQESQTGESNMEKVKDFGGKYDEEGESQYGERSKMAEETVDKSKERESEELEREGLPECLLLMMCEPKLSMEVCKETWVSSKDFFRRPSSRKPPPPPSLLTVSKDGQGKSKVSDISSIDTLESAKHDKHLVSAGVAAPPLQPGRSSCSLPVAPSMAEMLEEKLVNAVGYEPFVLTRCKSEPMRTAAAKLAPNSFFWKNRKLEPLRRASFGVGAAGLGF